MISSTFRAGPCQQEARLCPFPAVRLGLCLQPGSYCRTCHSAGQRPKQVRYPPSPHTSKGGLAVRASGAVAQGGRGSQRVSTLIGAPSGAVGVGRARAQRVGAWRDTRQPHGGSWPVSSGVWFILFGA